MMSLTRRLGCGLGAHAFRGVRTPAATYANALMRACSTAAKPPNSDASVDKVGTEADAQATAMGGLGSQGGLVLKPEEEENLPPLAFEPGVAGAAQKGVSAIVIAFGAAALGACAWGASQALFPSANRCTPPP